MVGIIVDAVSEVKHIRGEDIEDKQQNLNGAVSAWNIACLGGNARKAAIKKYRKQYRRMNPSHTKRDIK